MRKSNHRIFGGLQTGCVAVAAMLASAVHAQQGPVNGMRPADLRGHAIINATIVTAPGEGNIIEKGTIVIRDGVIVSVGANVTPPAWARVWDAEGLTVYPGLIEPALMIAPGDRATVAGTHWNARIRPEVSMADHAGPPANVRRDLRNLGFTVAAVYPSTGIVRGSGAVLALADETEYLLAYAGRNAMAIGFDTGGRGSGGGYPGSLMGVIALLRQTFSDAQWHAQCVRMYHNDPTGLEPPMRADALVALADVIEGRQRLLFEASDEQNALRFASLAAEFDLDMMILGSGMEFRSLNEILGLNVPLIVPVQYPARPNANTLAMAERTSLRDMQTWEQAPTNARRLVDGGATVALTTHGLRRRGDFHGNVRQAIEHGLSADAALAALTTTPAALLGIEDVAGTIAPGKAANLVVVKGKLFEKDATVRETWVSGRRFEISKDPDITLVGTGDLALSTGKEMKVDFDTTKRTVALHLQDGKKSRAKNVTVQRDHLSFIAEGAPFDVEGYVRFSGTISRGGVAGTGVMPDGAEFTFTIEVTEAGESTAGEEEAKPAEAAQDAAGEDDPVSGTWTVSVQIQEMPEPITVRLNLQRAADGSITGTTEAMGMAMEIDNVTFNPATGALQYVVESPGGAVTIAGIIRGESITGESISEMGRSSFSGTRTSKPVRGAQAASTGGGAAKDEPVELPPDELVYPLGEYGLRTPPKQQTVLIRGATIWTSGPRGIIEEGDLFIKGGVIEYVGPTVSWAWGQGDEPLIINARGKHITPGLIDCHSHTGITGGVNEFSHVNTAEVRIGDVINPDDINWYRQLAGGLTAANQLHGSANPIGGQNSVVKLKWGQPAEAYRVEDAIGGIKFALGENVVRSQNRYPNSRMGVETILCDAFTAAREYAQARRTQPERSDRRLYPVRRDYQLDTLAEILRGERLVHCHSYRQDEILMLVRVAQEFGFTVGTFQHVLEGYKVAEAIAEHGAGASSFSDWWGYKVEVMDAIPHNGAIMHNVGVNVSFNSDSNELARRMNTEASKAVRYGGVSREEALKFVTINPAWQLRIHERTGSLEKGKDADFVIWSGDPLSTYTRCEQTWIEGAKYFDIEEDRAMQKHVDSERQRLIQKILAQAHGKPASNAPATGEGEAEAPGEEGARPRGRRPRLMESLVDVRREAMEQRWRMGINPDEMRPGECGCNDWWSLMLWQ